MLFCALLIDIEHKKPGKCYKSTTSFCRRSHAPLISSYVYQLQDSAFVAKDENGRTLAEQADFEAVNAYKVEWVDQLWNARQNNDASSVPLQFARGPATGAGGRRIVGRGDGDDIADTHLHLQVATPRLMVVREEHQDVMGDDIGLVRVTREDHLTPDGILGSGNGYLFTIFTHHQLACFLPYNTIRPEHEGNDPALEALLAQALTEVVGEFANGGAGLVGIGCMVKMHTRILAERRGIGDDQAGVLPARHVVEPATQLPQAAAQAFLR